MASSKDTENLTAGLIIVIALVAGVVGWLVSLVVEQLIRIINKQTTNKQKKW